MSVLKESHDFTSLLPPEAWRRLPLPVRNRFTRELDSGTTICYRGETLRTSLSRWGWLLTQAARLIGAPLPLPASGDHSLATVVVTDDPENSAQIWTRLYHNAAGVPQVIQSIKKLSGPTGLEEYLGCGFSIALELGVREDALTFTGRHYYWSIAGIRLRLPNWLNPGTLTVSNRQAGEQAFHFLLTLEHPRLGMLIEQEVVFDDTATSVGRPLMTRRDSQTDAPPRMTLLPQ